MEEFVKDEKDKGIAKLNSLDLLKFHQHEADNV